MFFLRYLFLVVFGVATAGVEPIDFSRANVQEAPTGVFKTDPAIAAATEPAGNQFIDFHDKRSLELFGSVNNTHKGLAGGLIPLKTKAGEKELAAWLNEPLTDLVAIQARQALIKSLVDDEATLKKLQCLLEQFALYESAFGYFENQQALQAWESVLGSFRYSMSFLKSWNNSPAALNVRHVTQSFSPVFTFALEYFVLDKAMHALHHDHGESPVPAPNAPQPKPPEKVHPDGSPCHGGHPHDEGFLQEAWNAVWGFIFHTHEGHGIPENVPTYKKALIYAGAAAHTGFHLINLKDMYEFVKSKMIVVNAVYHQLAKLGVCVDIAGQLPDLQLEAGVVNYRPLRTALDSNYFKVDADRGMLSSVGDTIVAYDAIKKYRSVLRALQQRVGQYDVLVSLAQALKSRKDTNTPLCFVEFITNSAVPQLTMQDGWNVLMEGKSVVPLSFNVAENDAHKFVLTGPNGSGKSTFLRTLGLNTVLAQVFGIAAARSMSMTIFDRVITFITIADDITTGQSSFVARMMHANRCLERQRSLPAGKWSLVLLDDSVGQGTTMARGQQVAYEFVKELGEFTNNILISATHFLQLTKLERTDGFKNKRIALSSQNGQWHSEYKLEDGVSNGANVGVLTTS